MTQVHESKGSHLKLTDPPRIQGRTSQDPAHAACLLSPSPCSRPLCGKHPWVTPPPRCVPPSLLCLEQALPAQPGAGGCSVQSTGLLESPPCSEAVMREKEDDFTKRWHPPKSFTLETLMFLVFPSKKYLGILYFQHVFLRSDPLFH